MSAHDEQGGISSAEPPAEPAEAEVSPAEDLMREHGVLRRVLLIYDDVAGRIERDEAAPLDVVARAAGIVRSFVEEYHEKLEEQYLFPRFEKAGRLVDLVEVLDTQHGAGRRVTDLVLSAARSGAARDLPPLLRAFARMYRPHAAREDTVLFPALREIVSAKEYAELGEQFEEQERVRFGAQGFEHVVGEVARLEQVLGICDLAQFTPR